MKKLSKNSLINAIYLCGFILYLSLFQCREANAQQNYLISLKADIESLKFNTYSTRFIPIDSIASESGDILPQIVNELEHLQLSKFSGTYFLIKVGYYESDTIDVIKNEKAFINVKDLFKGSKSKKIILVDINCQDILSLNSQVREYEKATNGYLSNSIYISVYKSKKRIFRTKHKVQCYL